MEPNPVVCVMHWKKKLDKNPDDDIILNVIRKLSKIPITVKILEATHIGKSIRNLSKRDDIVGEKAKTLLNKWRNIFVNIESVRNSKQKSICDKDNVEKCSSKQNLTQDKTVYHHEKKSYPEQKEKHKKNSLHHGLSKQSSDKHLEVSTLSKSSHSLGESKLKYHSNAVDFDIDVQDRIIYNPQGLETFSSDGKNMIRKNPNSSDSHSSKRKSSTVEELDVCMNSFPKKFKSESHSSSDSEEKKKHNISIKKDKLVSQSFKKEFSNFKCENTNSVKQNSSSHAKKAKSDNSKIKNVNYPSESEEFTSTNVTFETCLSFNDIVNVKKKKSSKSKSSTKKSSSDSVKNKLDDKPGKSSPSDVKISRKSSHSSKEKTTGSIRKKSTMFDATKANSSLLSATLPDFKLSPNPSFTSSKKESHTNEDVIKFTSSRKEKTAIYSGRKSCNKGIPTLTQCCYRVLIDNIDMLGPMIDTPYDLLKPILEKCTPNQLFTMEKYNPQLLDYTNELWEIHCKRDYKLLSPLEHETWRDVYLRGFDELEEKLKNITANISASMLKATPTRQVKLAFIDSDVKPPRDVLRRQAKSRLLDSTNNAPKPDLPSKSNVKKTMPCFSASNQSFVPEKKDSIQPNNESLQNESPSKGYIKPVTPVVDPTASNKDTANNNLVAKKPKVAPLMAKTLKTMKQYFNRR